MPLTPDEQQAVRQMAEDLPALWDAPTTSAADRKRLLRLVIREVTVTPVADALRQAMVTVLWSGDVATTHTVTCPPRGWHCTTTPALVARVRELATHLPDHQIAALLNAEGLHTFTGKSWTYARVASLRKQHGLPTHCPLDPTGGVPRGDGLVPVAVAARMLGVSPSLIHIWADHGALVNEQRQAGSYRWVQLTDADVARLTGGVACGQWPSLKEVMCQRRCAGADVWTAVRAGRYVAYRRFAGQHWEWRLQERVEEDATACADVG